MKPGTGCGIMIYQEGKVLLGKRKVDDYKSDGNGSWTFPGGKLEYKESFEECIRREVYEETGLKLNSQKVIAVSNDVGENAHFVTVGFFSDDFEGIPKTMEPDKITEWTWFDLNELPDNIFKPSLNLIQNYLSNKFYIEKL